MLHTYDCSNPVLGTSSLRVQRRNLRPQMVDCHVTVFLAKTVVVDCHVTVFLAKTVVMDCHVTVFLAMTVVVVCLCERSEAIQF